MYLFSDLDKTLIFAGYPEEKCVEQYQERNITFMTEKAHTLLEEVLNSLTFIPCTMRSLTQTNRIYFIRDYKPKYMICTNGAEIFIDGKLDTNWEKLMRERISEEKTLEIQKLIDSLGLDLIENRNVNGFYLALKFKTNKLDNEMKIISEILPDDYVIQQDKIKIFVLPKTINKAFAITYLKDTYLDKKEILVAGDSNADEAMTKLDYVTAFIPAHATFKNEKAIRTKLDGITSTEELLTNILNKIKNI